MGKSVVGEAVYKINNEVAGKIIFDNKQNSEYDYYTGRKLPVYNKETTWYVDNQWILKLQIGDKTYGEANVEEKLNENIKITGTVSINDEFSIATINLVIEFLGELSSVTINGEVVEVTKNDEGKYVGQKDVNNNGDYSVVVRAKDGSLNKASIKVENLTEDMEIWNKNDLEEFRSKVSSGRTFAGKKAIVMDNIDLENVEWEPIGSNEKFFKGTFVGNKHIISNLYINNTKNYQALFSKAYNAKITGIVLDNVNIKARQYVAGILSYGENVIIEECGVNGIKIEATLNLCGGVAAKVSKGTISKCYNNVNITLNTTENIAYAGGIIASGENNLQILNCYNVKDVYLSAVKNATGQLGTRCGGIVGMTANISIESCYNFGKITSSGVVVEAGGIAGWLGGTNVNNCFNVGVIVGDTSSSDMSLHRYGDIVGISASSVNIANCYYVSSKICGFNHGGNVFPSSNIQDSKANIKTKSVQILGNNDDIWKQSDSLNNGWPILKWQDEI